MLISFLAPSGFGKSTAVSILQEQLNAENIRIAEPLYDFQNYFYQQLGISISNKQDGELLQFLGMKIRKEKPTFLLDEFRMKVINSKAKIITNDDCRPLDYEYLKRMGFIFVRINGYHRIRKDHTSIDLDNPNEWQQINNFDYEVDNFEDINKFKENLLNLMEVIKNDQMLSYPRTRKMSQ